MSELDPKRLDAAITAAFSIRENGSIDFDAAIETAIRAYLEAAPSPSPAPVVTFEQWWKASKYRQVIYAGASEQQIARDGWNAALASLSQPAKGEREVLDGGIDGPYNESAPLADVVATAQPALRQECATEGCDNPASVHFVRGDIGSYYCHACYLKAQALTPANLAQVTDAIPAETLRQLDILFARTTQGSWRTYQNGVHPVEVGGMGSGDDYAICTHGPKSFANADWIATMHDEWPRVRALLNRKGCVRS